MATKNPLKQSSAVKKFSGKLSAISGVIFIISTILFFVKANLSENQLLPFGITVDDLAKWAMAISILSIVLFISGLYFVLVDTIQNTLRATNILNKVIATTNEEDRHLSVTAPAGPWLQTSSWSEIVKKMREMLRVHGWGEVPTLLDLNYLIRITDDLGAFPSNCPERDRIKEGSDPHEAEPDCAISSITDFLRIDYVQWHRFKFATPRIAEPGKLPDLDDDNRHVFSLDLHSILTRLAQTYVVMPFDDFAVNSRIFSDFAVIYPITDKIKECYRSNIKKDDKSLVRELRCFDWMSTVDDKLIEGLYKRQGDRQEFDRVDEAKGKQTLLDNGKLDYSPLTESDHGPVAFTIKIIYPGKEQGHMSVARVRFVSLFDGQGAKRKAVGRFLEENIEKDSEIRVANIVETTNSVVGCYTPIPQDLRNLKKICDQISSLEQAAKVQVLYNWAYLHVRAISRADGGKIYRNDSFSFPLSNVALLEKAEFRAEGGVSFESEYAVIPYTMDFAENTAAATDGDRNIVKFSGRHNGDGTSLVTCPTDVFHISWDFDEVDPERERLQEENERLNEENERLNAELRRKDGEGSSPTTPNKVIDLPASKRVAV